MRTSRHLRRRSAGHRRSAAAALTTTALAASLLVAGAPAQAERSGDGATAPRAGEALVHGGQSFGSTVRGLGVVGSGRTALTTMCTADPSRTHSNDVAATEPALSDAVDLGVVTTTVESGRTDAGQRSTTSTSTVASLDLLGGLLSLEGVSSQAQVVRAANGFRTSTTSQIAALSVGGVPIPLDQLSENAPGEIALPGLGTLFFNEGATKSNRDSGFARVTAVRIELPALDAEVKLGLAQARLGKMKEGVFSGGAYATRVKALGLLGSGRTGFQPLPCLGSGAETLRSNDTAAVTIQDALDVGVTESTTRTFKRRNGDVVAVARNAIAGVDLAGQFGIEALSSRVVTVRKPGGRITTRPTFRVLGLTVGGEAQEVPAPGERIDLPGLGFLEFGGVQRFRNGSRIIALKVQLLDGDTVVLVDVSSSTARILR